MKTTAALLFVVFVLFKGKAEAYTTAKNIKACHKLEVIKMATQPAARRTSPRRRTESNGSVLGDDDVRLIASAIASATGCSNFAQRRASFLGEIKRKWFVNDDEQSDDEQSEFADTCYRILADETVPFAQVGKTEAKSLSVNLEERPSLSLGNNQTRYPDTDEDFSKYFWQMKTNMSFIPLLLSMHCGFDEKARPNDSEKPEFMIWPVAQPEVNDRNVSIDRLTSGSKSGSGLLDHLVNADLKDKAATLEKLTKQDCHVCLYALDQWVAPDDSSHEQTSTTTEIQRPPEDGVSIHCVITSVIGEQVKHSGAIYSDTPPRTCTYDDLKAAFRVLTNQDFEEAFHDSLQNLSNDSMQNSEDMGATKMFLCYRALEIAYLDFQLDTEEGWMRLYYVLLVGWKILKTGNAASLPDRRNEFITPKSLPELMVRTMFLHNACIRLRTSTENGQGRIMAFRHALTCIYPSSKPLKQFTSKSKEASEDYFESVYGKKGNHAHAAETLLPLLKKKVSTTVCIANVSPNGLVWSVAIPMALKATSRRLLKGTDGAIPRQFVQIVLGALRTLAQNEEHEIGYKGVDKEKNVETAKPVLESYTQLQWLLLSNLLQESQGWAVMEQTLTREKEAYVRAHLKNVAVKNTEWMKDPNQKKQNGGITYEGIQEKYSSGFKTLNPLMISTRKSYGELDPTRDPAKNMENAVKYVMQEKDAFLFLILRLNRKSKFSSFLSSGTSDDVARGDPAIPMAIRVVGFICCCIYDRESLERIRAFVNNNGQGTEETEATFLVSPADACSEDEKGPPRVRIEIYLRTLSQL